MTETYDNHASALRQQARDAIAAGRLPARSPAGVWGGPGTGKTCAVCGRVIGGDGLGFEVEFGGDEADAAEICHFHIWCFAAWEFECESFLPAADDGGTISGRERDGTHQREPR